MANELAEVEAFQELGIPFGLTASDLDDTNTAYEILAKVVTAKTLEDLYNAESVEKFADHIGEVFTIRDFRYMPSDHEGDDGTPPELRWPYVVMECVDADGSPVTITTGAKKVVLYLAIARANDLLPAPFKFLEATTASGNTIRSLGRP